MRHARAYPGAKRSPPTIREPSASCEGSHGKRGLAPRKRSIRQRAWPQVAPPPVQLRLTAIRTWAARELGYLPLAGSPPGDCGAASCARRGEPDLAVPRADSAAFSTRRAFGGPRFDSTRRTSSAPPSCAPPSDFPQAAGCGSTPPRDPAPGARRRHRQPRTLGPKRRPRGRVMSVQCQGSPPTGSPPSPRRTACRSSWSIRKGNPSSPRLPCRLARHRGRQARLPAVARLADARVSPPRTGSWFALGPAIGSVLLLRGRWRRSSRPSNRSSCGNAPAYVERAGRAVADEPGSTFPRRAAGPSWSRPRAFRKPSIQRGGALGARAAEADL
jgi:hypothetical protein